ncbi:Protein VAC14-like protein [Smittium culicis]|uniref:Protein VAC14-like protein n=1 Tax=Smittium culicis TaxID=133412 RepID=A0A1R1Y9J8_9FUNG|nr:Protein VAC14-like protein [Smittium culicis]
MRELVSEYDKNSVSSVLIEISEELVSSSKETARSGGVLALAACSIALGPENVYEYLDFIVPPILTCLSDLDPKVRYYSCEALYNVAKVARGSILGWFNEITDMLSRVTADPTHSVKDSADYVDRLIKDIVTEEATSYLSLENSQSSISDSIVADSNRKIFFSLERFIPLLSERMHTFKAATRLYLIEWIRILDSIPGLDLIRFLPSFLDQLIRFLSDPKDDVRLKASNVLIELLREVEECAGLQELADDLWPNTQNQNHRNFNVLNTKPTNANHFNSYHKKTSSGFTDDYNAINEASEEIKMAARRKKIREERKHYLSHNYSSPSLHENSLISHNYDVYVDHAACLDILVVHLHSNDQEILATSLNWVFSFSYICPSSLITLTPPLISALLPLSSHSVPSVCELALKINRRLQYLVCSQPILPKPIQRNFTISPQDSNSVLESHGSNLDNSNFNDSPNTSHVMDTSNPSNKFNYTVSEPDINYNDDEFFSYDTVVNVIILLFNNNVHENTKVEGLKWLLLLHKSVPDLILTPEESSFPFLLKVLCDSSENVVKLDLELFAQIALYSEYNLNSSSSDYDSKNSYLDRFCKSLLQIFFNDNQMLHSRMSLIIRQLCLVLDPERVFRVFSMHLHKFLVSYKVCPESTNFIPGPKKPQNKSYNYDYLNFNKPFPTMDNLSNPFSYTNESLMKKSNNEPDTENSPNSPNFSSTSPLDDLSFGQEIIQQLTWILISAPEASILRKLLRMNDSEIAKYYSEKNPITLNHSFKAFTSSFGNVYKQNTSQYKKFYDESQIPKKNLASQNGDLPNVHSHSREISTSELAESLAINDIESVNETPKGSNLSSEKTDQHKKNSTLIPTFTKKTSIDLSNNIQSKKVSEIELSSNTQHNANLSDDLSLSRKINECNDATSLITSPNIQSDTVQLNIDQNKSLNRPNSKLPQFSRLFHPSSPPLSTLHTANESGVRRSIGPQIISARPESPATVSPITASSVAKTNIKKPKPKTNILPNTLLKNNKLEATENMINAITKPSLHPPKNSRRISNISSNNVVSQNNIENDNELLERSSRVLDTHKNPLDSSESVLLSKLNINGSEVKKMPAIPKNLFDSLFLSWSCNPVSTLVLCFLSQRYQLAYLILEHISQDDIPHTLLNQLDVLVQLLESPIFAFLRMQLLNHERYPYLSASLYGILMILPQSVAFLALKNRLSSISNTAIFNHGPLPHNDEGSFHRNKEIGHHDKKDSIRSVLDKKPPHLPEDSNEKTIHKSRRSSDIKGDPPLRSIPYT